MRRISSPRRLSQRAAFSATSISTTRRRRGSRRGPSTSCRTRHEAEPFGASEDNLAHAFDFLARQHPPLPGGTFIFVFSDFLAPVSDDTWVFTLERGWDVVPVIVQDPVWERSFPEVGGVVVPLHDRSTGRFVSVRLTDREAIRRREENEARSEDLLLRLRALDLGPVRRLDHRS